MNAEVDPPDKAAKSPRGSINIARGIVVLFLLILVAVGLSFGSQFHDVALRPSTVTTLNDHPLDSNGQVDYLKAFEAVGYSKHISTEKNGFRLVVQQVDLSNNLSGPLFDQLCIKLGLDPSKIGSRLKYVDPSKCMERYHTSAEFDVELIRKIDKSIHPTSFEDDKKYDDWDVENLLSDRTGLPWTKDQLPMMSAWVVENSPALNVYARALRMETFECPLVPYENCETLMDSTPIFAWCYTYNFELREVASGFSVRANYFFGEGEIRRALDDVISCKRLGRHLRNRFTVIDRGIGSWCESLADRIGIAHVKTRQISADELEYFLLEIESIPELADTQMLKLYEKYRVASLINKISKEPEFFEPPSENTAYLMNLGLDWNVVFRECRDTFEAVWDKPDSDPKMELISELVHTVFNDEEFLKLTTLDSVSRVARSQKVGQVIGVLKSGFSVKWNGKEDRCIANVKAITIAMLRYEKDHGTLRPAFSADEKGNPLHSWRVLLLPYLSQKDLHNKIRLDEPWNSPHNSRFAKDCPTIFACPNCDKNIGGQTNYSVILGKGLPFEGASGKRLDDFGPDSNDMILIAERRIPVDWMDPTRELTHKEAARGVYLQFRSSKKAPVGGHHFCFAHFGVRSGAVVTISETVDPSVYRSMIKGMNQETDYY